MKPFNLEAAKAGKPVCLADGRTVRILCFDRKSATYPLLGLVLKGDEEFSVKWTINGKGKGNEQPAPDDLFMATKKRTGWINIYNPKDQACVEKRIYPSFEDGKQDMDIMFKSVYIDTIEIEWEE